MGQEQSGLFEGEVEQAMKWGREEEQEVEGKCSIQPPPHWQRRSGRDRETLASRAHGPPRTGSLDLNYKMVIRSIPALICNPVALRIACHPGDHLSGRSLPIFPNPRWHFSLQRGSRKRRSFRFHPPQLLNNEPRGFANYVNPIPFRGNHRGRIIATFTGPLYL